MLKRLATIITFAFIVGAFASVATARAQTCCVCTECMEQPEQARCFADLDDTQCTDFCMAQECAVREFTERSCLAPLCAGFPSAQPAPALGAGGLAITMLGIWLVGRRGVQRGKRPAV